MSHTRYRDCVIPLSNTTVRCCKCYVEYWKQLKEAKITFCEFNYSLEKAFTYRKYFENDKILYHFCINCLHEVISNIPMRIFEFELMMKNRGGCIYMYKNNQISLGECCSICINFVILRFTSCFFIDV